LSRYAIPLFLCLTLGLAPFVPEPHIVGKIRWVEGGAVGMGLMDWGDLAMHGLPFVWLAGVAITDVVKLILGRGRGGGAEPEADPK
jgi:hypothetical protein